MIEPPTLVQYNTGSFNGVDHGTVSITYQTGDMVLVFTGTGGQTVTGVSDSGSSFSVLGSGFWRLWYTLSAVGSTGVLTNIASADNFTVIVVVLRGVSAIGANTGSLSGSGSTISAPLAIAAGSRLVGMLGVAFNASGNVTLSTGASGKSLNGDFRTQVGNGHDGHALIGLVDTDGSVTSASTPSLQLTPSLSSNWEAIAIELKGTETGNPVYPDWYLVGDIIDSDGLVRSANTFNGNGLQVSARKGSFPCIPQNGGAPVVQTYASGFVSTRFSFTYGSIEVEAKLGGSGFHNTPIFMLGCQAKPWPNYGSGPNPLEELDAAESGINNTNATTYRCFANPPNHTTDVTPGYDPTAGYHTYKIVWTPTSVTWSTDGVQVDQITSNIPSTPMYILSGGYMGEYAINDSLLPTYLSIRRMTVLDSNGLPVSNSGQANIVPAQLSGASASWLTTSLVNSLRGLRH